MADKNERKIAVPELLIPVDGKSPPLLLTPPSPVSSARRALTKQSSQRTNCLCSPTTHAGSFRCRLHRGSSLIRSSASVGSGLSEISGRTGSFRRRLSELADETAAGGASVGV